jgi:diguanylate cyclase (GGDEF)-like protein
MKAINDRHGHAAGDEALRAAAELLRTTFRQADAAMYADKALRTGRN